MKNLELAEVFDQIADLMELIGEDPFRINSYRKAARTLEDLGEDIEQVAEGGGLTDLPGIGKGSAERIEQFLKTGKIQVHEELLAKVPGSLLELRKIPGMGPKTLALAWKQLKITDMSGLTKAIDQGKLQALPGMGEKKAAIIKDGIEFLHRSAGRTPLGLALPLAEKLVEQLKLVKGVKEVQLAGSLRRWSQTVGDIDILVQADDGAAVIDKFVKFPQVKEVLSAGGTKGSVRTVENIQVDVRVIGAKSFGAALQYFTGSKEHNVALREIALKHKWKLNEYGLFAGDKQLAGAKEEDIYAKLGLPWMPPELRQNRGEIQQADNLPKLIELNDIRGDIHLHTTASDGRNSIEQMAQAGRQMGYEYIVITEHSQSSRIAGGLNPQQMARHAKNIRKVAEGFKDIAVLVGVEVDILAEGTLDYPDSLLSELDLVIASIHSGLGQDSKMITGRLLKAMENRHVDVIGHPTGRLLGQRQPSAVDISALITQAVATGTALELNASWQRLDLKDVHLRQARAAGAKIAIGTDAHGTEQLNYMIFGLYTARRGWLEKSDVLNCLPLKKFKEWLK